MSMDKINEWRTRAAWGYLRCLTWTTTLSQKDKDERYFSEDENDEKEKRHYWASKKETANRVNALRTEVIKATLQAGMKAPKPLTDAKDLKKTLSNARIHEATLEWVSFFTPGFRSTYEHGPDDSYLWQSLWGDVNTQDPILKKLLQASNLDYDSLLDMQPHSIVSWLDSFPRHAILLFSAFIQLCRRSYNPSQEKGTPAAIKKTLELASYYHIKHRLYSVYGLDTEELLRSSDFLPDGGGYRFSNVAIPLPPRAADTCREFVGYDEEGKEIEIELTPDQLVTFEPELGTEFDLAILNYEN